MAKTVILDELHLTVRIPDDLPEVRVEVIRRTLTGRAFMTRLRQAVRALLRSYPELAVVQITLTR